MYQNCELKSRVIVLLKIIALVAFQLGETSGQTSKHIISSEKLTDWGEWGEFERCPEGTYVIGMQLKVEAEHGWKDDTGVNGIKLLCSKLSRSRELFSEVVTVTSSVGPWGQWGQTFYCPKSMISEGRTSAAVSFQLKVEQSRGMHDDTATNNVRIFCSDFLFDDISHIQIEGDGTNWGQWGEPHFCNKGYAICGIATQIDHGQKKGYDDTALNNVKAECCKVHGLDLPPTPTLPTIPHAPVFPDPIESAKALESAVLQKSSETNAKYSEGNTVKISDNHRTILQDNNNDNVVIQISDDSSNETRNHSYNENTPVPNATLEEDVSWNTEPTKNANETLSVTHVDDGELLTTTNSLASSEGFETYHNYYYDSFHNDSSTSSEDRIPDQERHLKEPDAFYINSSNNAVSGIFTNPRKCHLDIAFTIFVLQAFTQFIISY